MKIGKKRDIIGLFTIINPILLVVIINFLFMVTPLYSQSFKNEQKRYPRVKEAYAEKYDVVDSLLVSKGILISGVEIFLRGVKSDKKLELYAKNKKDTLFQLIREYDFCMLSGELGPKREQGDMQVPEGFYYIDRFNPTSYFHLSLGINYPNNSDRKLSNSRDLGGDIFIHGDCVSVGCIPITDEVIKELYVICIEAKSNGQSKIPVHIFPFIMDEFLDCPLHYSTDLKKINFWNSLVEGYQFFEEKKSLPKIIISKTGVYQLDPIGGEITSN